MNADIDGSIIKYMPKAGTIHINKYNRPRDLVIKIKTVVYGGKDKSRFEKNENTYKEYCRIVGK